MRSSSLLVLFALFSGPFTYSLAEGLPLLVQDSFEEGLSHWHTSDPTDGPVTWEIISSNESSVEKMMLRSNGGSKYEPPYRSPWNLALLKLPVVSDFELSVRVLNTNYDAGGHRDLCIFWGYQDPGHFYYVHLGAVPDPHSCQIFIVNGADRKAITQKESTGTPWDRDWHDVKVTHNTESGSMNVFFDDMIEPVMTATDKKFSWGRVGLGTFDDNGNFDDFKLRGIAIEPVPAGARLPPRSSPIE
ncbi:hypothetical protein [Bythopirellula polymerisocia]|uniref:Uncharacterized protein n=1 Tax=Bythopirellula polymerisocia TaxID=2528003 RepID=A0A5C6CSI5_9BACT|nr:hypothetical protein [Bythopirellula polymerisocia]TWU27472.1 hypothetical protein Pla144_22460 [Bythopirellula polymerisocia]